MKILGVGLSRTGTTSLAKALTILGFKTLHWSPERLRHVILDGVDRFNCYDDVEAVTDIPAAYFYKELKATYPNCKLILTERDISSWFKSVQHHYQVRIPTKFNKRHNETYQLEADLTQQMVYGSNKVNEFLYKKRYVEHNAEVLRLFPETLILNIVGGDGWEKLCPYLEVNVPNLPFPCENVTTSSVI